MLPGTPARAIPGENAGRHPQLGCLQAVRVALRGTDLGHDTTSSGCVIGDRAGSPGSGSLSHVRPVVVAGVDVVHTEVEGPESGPRRPSPRPDSAGGARNMIRARNAKPGVAPKPMRLTVDSRCFSRLSQPCSVDSMAQDLVERAQVVRYVDRVLRSVSSGTISQHRLVGRGQHHRCGGAVAVGARPVEGGDAPAVARDQAGELVLRASAWSGRCRCRAGGRGTRRSPPRRSCGCRGPRVRSRSTRRGRSRSSGRCRRAPARRPGRCARSRPQHGSVLAGAAPLVPRRRRAGCSPRCRRPRARGLRPGRSRYDCGRGHPASGVARRARDRGRRLAGRVARRPPRPRAGRAGRARDRAYFEARSAALLDHVTVAVERRRAARRRSSWRTTSCSSSWSPRPPAAAASAGLLLAAAEEQVRAAGHGEIWLAVVPGNTTARRFYAAHGWVDRGAETYDARDPGRGHRAGARAPVRQGAVEPGQAGQARGRGRPPSRGADQPAEQRRFEEEFGADYEATRTVLERVVGLLAEG